MNFIKEALERERTRKAQQAFDDGYCWAAGWLLRGRKIMVVLSALDDQRPVEFDRGARKACEDYAQLAQDAALIRELRISMPDFAKSIEALKDRP